MPNTLKVEFRDQVLKNSSNWNECFWIQQFDEKLSQTSKNQIIMANVLFDELFSRFINRFIFKSFVKRAIMNANFDWKIT